VSDGRAAQIVKTYPQGARDDSSLLEEMGLRPALKQRLLDHWQGDFVELGGGIVTLTREQLESVSNDDLKEWGLTGKEIAEIRRALDRARERESYR
jgi:hypothetical protein